MRTGRFRDGTLTAGFSRDGGFVVPGGLQEVGGLAGGDVDGGAGCGRGREGSGSTRGDGADFGWIGGAVAVGVGVGVPSAPATPRF